MSNVSTLTGSSIAEMASSSVMGIPQTSTQTLSNITDNNTSVVTTAVTPAQFLFIQSAAAQGITGACTFLALFITCHQVIKRLYVAYPNTVFWIYLLRWAVNVIFTPFISWDFLFNANQSAPQQVRLSIYTLKKQGRLILEEMNRETHQYWVGSTTP